MNGEWSKIWKAAVPERCKTFIWMLKHDRILTNYSKNKKGLGSAACQLCGAVCETSIHAMRDCYKSMQVWKSLVPSDIMQQFYAANMEDWISININYSGNNNMEWCNTWIIACHALWTWRNQEEHQENFIRPSDPVVQILKRGAEYRQALGLLKTVGEERCMYNCRRWTPPSSSTIKLNTDGACNSDLIVGCGGVLRDHEGRWIGGFSKYVGRGSAILAEFWGVFEGLKLTQRLGFSKVELNVDALQVVDAIRKTVVDQVDCVALLRQILELMDSMEVVILELMDSMEVVIVSHVYRSANSCADSLARRGCRETSFVYFEKAPDFLISSLEADVVGIVPTFVSV